MPLTTLTARSRAAWEYLAAAPAAFTPFIQVAVSPKSRICPPGWIGIVVIEDVAIATAPDQHTAASRPVTPDLPSAALRRQDIDLTTRTVTIERSLTELPGGGYLFGPPKSDAGERAVVFPDLIAGDLTWHLARFTASGDDALVFTSPTGEPLRHSNFRRRVWLPARDAAGIPPIHTSTIFGTPGISSPRMREPACAS